MGGGSEGHKLKEVFPCDDPLKGAICIINDKKLSELQLTEEVQDLGELVHRASCLGTLNHYQAEIHKLLSGVACNLRDLMVVERVRGKVLIELLPAERKLSHWPSLNIKMV